MIAETKWGAQSPPGKTYKCIVCGRKTCALLCVSCTEDLVKKDQLEYYEK